MAMAEGLGVEKNKGQGASQANRAFLCNRGHLFGRD